MQLELFVGKLVLLFYSQLILKMFAENHDIRRPYPKAKRKEISSVHSIIQTPDRDRLV